MSRQTTRIRTRPRALPRGPGIGSLLILALALAGCLSSTPDVAEAGIRGAFTPERTSQDLQDFDSTARAHGARDIAIMESFPEQFSITIDAPSCDGLKQVLLDKPYLTGVRGC